MEKPNSIYKNLVFQGGGVKGISYLGMLEVLDEKGILDNIERVAGTSAGAITACIVSLGLPFREIKRYADTLEYKKVPQKSDLYIDQLIPHHLANELEEKLSVDINCLFRLITNYGWYSSDYFYQWLQSVIAEQFDPLKKAPPYTFADFKNKSIHKDLVNFRDLSVIGTDMTNQSTRTFSYKTVPDMEVATAVRISMSIPLFFESIMLEERFDSPSKTHIFSDGGVIRNYPINIYDEPIYGNTLTDDGINLETLGGKFEGEDVHKPIHTLIDYIQSLIQTYTRAQSEQYRVNPVNHARSIAIDTSKISSTDFDITTGDEKYNYLYHQGVDATKAFFE